MAGISFDFLGHDKTLGKTLGHIGDKFDAVHSAAKSAASEAGTRFGTVVGKGIGGLITHANKLGRASSGLRDVGGGLALIGVSAGGVGVAATLMDSFSGAVDLASAGQEAFGAAGKIAAAGQWLLNAALTANPIGLVIAALVLLGGALFLAYKKSETFRNIVKGVFEGVSKAAGVFKTVVVGYIRFVANFWLTVVGALVTGAAKAFGWVPGIGGKLKGAAKEFDGFKDKVNASLAGINETKTITIKAVSSSVAEKAANAGIASGALSGSEAAASVTTRSGAQSLRRSGGSTTVVVNNTLNKRGITTTVSQGQRKAVRNGAKPAFGL